MKATTTKTPVKETIVQQDTTRNQQQEALPNQPIAVENPDPKLFHTCIDDNGNEYLVTLCGLTCGGFLYPQGKKIDPQIAHNFVSNRIRSNNEDDLSEVTVDSKEGNGKTVEKQRSKPVQRKAFNTNTITRDLSYQTSMTLKSKRNTTMR